MASEVRHLSGLAAVPLRELRPSPNNPRERVGDVEGLALSIREQGLIQPIIVQRVPDWEGYQIVAGHRRFAAILRLGWSTVPCIIRRDILPDEELLAMLVENGQRADLDPIEEARALNRLKKSGLTDLEVARKIGRSQSHVSARLALLSLPPEEQEEIRAGVVGITAGVLKARTESGKLRRGRVNGVRSPVHLGPLHALAGRAKARCNRLGHPKGYGKGVGGIACGECWEHVIRAYERRSLHDQSEARGRCVLCDTTHDPDGGSLSCTG